MPMLFVFQSQRQTIFYYPVDPSEKYSVFAVRWKNFKAHYYTRGMFNICYTLYINLTTLLFISNMSFPPNSGAAHSESTPDNDCSLLSFLKYHDPPLLFNLEADPSENYNLDGTEWDPVRKQIQTIKEQFEASMVFGESEISKGIDSALEPCCTPSCTPKPQCCHCTAAL